MSAAAVRPIWLCADDYGISPAVSAAIRDLVMGGRLNATSVMVVAPSFNRSEAVSLDLLNAGGKRVAIGLHVTLTAPFVPHSPGYEPLRDGALLPLQTTLQRALLRTLSRERIEAEVAAQLRAFADAFGRAPDFVDGHQHVQLFPQVRDALLTVVKQVAPAAWVRQCGRPPAPLRQRVADRKGLLLDMLSGTFRRRAAALGITTNPAFAGTYDFADQGVPDFAALFPRFLEGLPVGGLIMCHPGRVDAELERLDPLTVQREREYAYFAGPEFPAALAAAGAVLAENEPPSKG
jgi:predicted glycoside hydrolase/deacetylase ChbG (UPF0249 family)